MSEDTGSRKFIHWQVSTLFSFFSTVFKVNSHLEPNEYLLGFVPAIVLHTEEWTVQFPGLYCRFPKFYLTISPALQSSRHSFSDFSPSGTFRTSPFHERSSIIASFVEIRLCFTLTRLFDQRKLFKLSTFLSSASSQPEGYFSSYRLYDVFYPPCDPTDFRRCD